MTKRPPNLDPPRRKRALTSAERDLWESVAKAAKPLRKQPRRTEIVSTPAESDTSPAETALAKTPAPQRFLKPPREASSATAAKKPAPPPLAPLGRREKSHLARGRKDIDARIDLHGMTQARAHRALRNFLHEASESGMTFVLVITGKGKSGGADTERGVLRRQVPEWLSLPEFRTMVVGFEEAAIGHGGAGALYVRVRRVK